MLDQLVEGAKAKEAWVPAAAKSFVAVCDVVATVATQHHDMLVRRFIEKPTRKVLERHMETLTASGMELNALLADLVRLRDLRLAADVEGIGSRHEDMKIVREWAEKAD